MLKIASWNVNSLTVRLEQVLAWLHASQVDVLALQETKLMDDRFPEPIFNEHGFQVVYSGQKTYNGVAFVSKYPMADVMTDIPDWVDPQRRILAATIAGVRLINLYVPNGASVGSDKYDYKLTWLSKVTAYIKHELSQHERVAVMGDFNIAPADRDVHDPSAWEGSVLVSPRERDAFFELLATGLEDGFRLLHEDTDAYSWWDYRAAAFRRNLGLRIDHILLSKALSRSCVEVGIDVEPRRAERPSDHAPIWAMFNMAIDD